MKKSILLIIVCILLPISLSAGNINPINKSKISIWLNKNLNYPASSIENREEGIVYVSFTVTENGKSENVKIKEGISNELDSEALKAVINMPLISLFDIENPNKEYVLPIKFTLK